MIVSVTMSATCGARTRTDVRRPRWGLTGVSAAPEVPSGTAAARRREGCGGRRLRSGGRGGDDRAVQGDVVGSIRDRLLSAAPALAAREGAQEGERGQAFGVRVGEHGALE